MVQLFLDIEKSSIIMGGFFYMHYGKKCVTLQRK